MYRGFKLNSLTDTYEQAAVIFPFILGAPRYFQRRHRARRPDAHRSAFGQVQRSLSWFVTVYPTRWPPGAPR